MKVELDLFNYLEKTDLKGATYIDTSMLTSKENLSGWKSKVDNLDLNKLTTVPAELAS